MVFIHTDLDQRKHKHMEKFITLKEDEFSKMEVELNKLREEVKDKRSSIVLIDDVWASDPKQRTFVVSTEIGANMECEQALKDLLGKIVYRTAELNEVKKKTKELKESTEFLIKQGDKIVTTVTEQMKEFTKVPKWIRNLFIDTDKAGKK